MERRQCLFVAIGLMEVCEFDVRPFVTFMFWCCIGIRADLCKVGMKPPASLFCVAYSVSFHGRIIAVEPGFKICLKDELGLRSMDHFFERLHAYVWMAETELPAPLFCIAFILLFLFMAEPLLWSMDLKFVWKMN